MILNKGDVITTIESVKAVAEVFTPVGGEIVEINLSIVDEPSLLNEDPYGDGWLAKIKLENPSEVNELMNASDYTEYRK